MRTPKQQQGMTAIGWLIVLMLIGFIALIVLKITPVYTEYFTVVSSMESLKQENLTGMDQSEIKKLLQRRFEVNDVRRVSKDDIEISKTRGSTTVRVSYEAKEKFVANVSLLLEFDKSIEVQ